MDKINPIKLIKHINKVGFAQFLEEYKNKQREIALDPTTALRMQSNGYTGVILFSFVTMIIFAFMGWWTIAGIFIFNMLIMFGQLLGVRKNLLGFIDMKKMEVESMAEEETKKEEEDKEEEKKD